MSEDKLYATLVVGNTYVLNGRFFENGKAMEVTTSEMNHLKKNAVVRNKSTNGKVFLEQQFSFEKMNEADFADIEEDEDEDEEKPKKAKKGSRPAVKKRVTDDVVIED